MEISKRFSQDSKIIRDYTFIEDTLHLEKKNSESLQGRTELSICRSQNCNFFFRWYIFIFKQAAPIKLCISKHKRWVLFAFLKISCISFCINSLLAYFFLICPPHLITVVGIKNYDHICRLNIYIILLLYFPLQLLLFQKNWTRIIRKILKQSGKISSRAKWMSWIDTVFQNLHFHVPVWPL